MGTDGTPDSTRHRRANSWRARPSTLVRAVRTVLTALIDLPYSFVWRTRSYIIPATGDRFAPGDPSLPTIVPVTGVFERWDFVIPLLDRLNRAGYPIFVIDELGRNYGSIRSNAHAVRAAIERAGIDRAIILGHSKGAMTGKVVMLEQGDGTPRPVLGMVALAPPFGGTGLLTFAPRGTELGMFRPDSRESVGLDAHEEVDDRIVTIQPMWDELVWQSGAVRRGANVVIPVVGHGLLIGDPRTADSVEQAVRLLALQAAEPAAELSRPRGSSRRQPMLPKQLRPQSLVAWAVDYVWAGRAQVASVRTPEVPRQWAVRDGGRDVVLLPGVLEKWPFLWAIGDRLSADGHAVHVLPELGLNRSSFAMGAEVLAEYLVAHDLKDVVLVAHSKGGLIGKTALIRPDSGPRIAHMVAIASPFSGSMYARWLWQRSMRAFAPTSSELRRLGLKEEVNGLITAVRPVFDPHIPGDRDLPGAAANIELPLAGHFAILDDPLLVEVVSRLVHAVGKHPTDPATTQAVGDALASGNLEGVGLDVLAQSLVDHAMRLPAISVPPLSDDPRLGEPNPDETDPDARRSRRL